MVWRSTWSSSSSVNMSGIPLTALLLRMVLPLLLLQQLVVDDAAAIRVTAFPNVPATTKPTARGAITSAWTCRRRRRRTFPVTATAAAPRYGPPMDHHQGDTSSSSRKNTMHRNNNKNQQLLEQDFRRLVDQILSVQDPNHIPSLLTKNVELILSISESISDGSSDGVQVVERILEDAQFSSSNNDNSDNNDSMTRSRRDPKMVASAIDIILTFAEQFVQQAADMEDKNKRLLGQIVRTFSNPATTSTTTSTTTMTSTREDQLDALLQREKNNFTAGFLRHLDNECERIAQATAMTPESARLLQLLRLVQSRVVEELGRDLGEAAQVLGQLIGYESVRERLAVLETGLAVRGPAFAREMLALTQEALQGFGRVIGGVDPGLVQCVEEIQERLQRYLDDLQP